MQSRSWKVGLISLSLLVAGGALVYIYLGLQRIVYTPYLFGFILQPSEIAYNPELSLHYYLGEMHEYSIVYVVFSQVMQEITGNLISWFYIPAAAIIGIICLALYPADNFNHRLAVAAVAVVGPPGLFGYIYVFSRDFLDIVFILMWLLAVRILSDKELGKVSFLTTFVFSALIWLNHYSFWPLFVLTVVTVSVLSRKVRLSNIGGLFFPFALYAAPARVFVSSGSLLSLPTSVADAMQLVTNFFARGGEPPADWMQVQDVPQALPKWLPEYVLVAIAAITAIFAVVYLLNIDYRALLARDKHRQQLFFACGIAVAGYSVLLVLRGYIYRATIVWPVIAPLFAAELYRLDIKLPQTQVQAATIFVALILLMGCVNVAAPQYYTPEQNTGVPGSHQIASAGHATYVPEQAPVYTDLVHGSELLLQGTHENVISGETRGTENGSVALSPDIWPLFGKWETDERAYTVVTANGKIGIRTWGGAIPPTNNDHDREYLKIYSNGDDYWYRNLT